MGFASFWENLIERTTESFPLVQRVLPDWTPERWRKSALGLEHRHKVSKKLKSAKQAPPLAASITRLPKKKRHKRSPLKLQHKFGEPFQILSRREQRIAKTSDYPPSELFKKKPSTRKSRKHSHAR